MTSRVSGLSPYRTLGTEAVRWNTHGTYENEGLLTVENFFGSWMEKIR